MVCFPIDSGGVSPEQFEVVVASVCLVEYVDDDVNIVDEDPATVFVSGYSDPRLADLFGEFVDVVGDGLHLAFGCAGAYYEVVAYGAAAAQVENYDVLGVVFLSDAGACYGELLDFFG